MPTSRLVVDPLEDARREKRTAKLQGYVPPSLRKFYEERVTARKSLSDCVYEALEAHAAMEIAKQSLGARAGRN
jgi:hypothetical protein